MTVDWSKLLPLVGTILATIYVTLRMDAVGGWLYALDNWQFLAHGALIVAVFVVAALVIDPDSTL